MLADELTPGTLIVGLAELLRSGRPAMDGLYRVVRMNNMRIVEFFEAATRPPANREGMETVRVLPYRLDKIADVALGGREAISGEFTGCLMTVFNKDGAAHAGHVDTNTDTSQREAWNAMRGDGTLEYDTTGKLTAYPGGAEGKCILCVARHDRIDHVFVRKSSHSWGAPKPNHLGGMSAQAGVKYEVLPDHGL